MTSLSVCVQSKNPAVLAGIPWISQSYFIPSDQFVPSALVLFAPVPSNTHLCPSQSCLEGPLPCSFQPNYFLANSVCFFYRTCHNIAICSWYFDLVVYYLSLLQKQGHLCSVPQCSQLDDGIHTRMEIEALSLKEMIWRKREVGG